MSIELDNPMIDTRLDPREVVPERIEVEVTATVTFKIEIDNPLNREPNTPEEISADLNCADFDHIIDKIRASVDECKWEAWA